MDRPESARGRCWLAVVGWSTTGICQLESRYGFVLAVSLLLSVTAAVSAVPTATFEK